jgi:energy-coupling factor transporter ATP-binding protein EcfA2
MQNNDEVSKISVSAELVIIAEAEFEIVKGMNNEFYAYPKSGPRVCKTLSDSNNSLASDLRAKYFNIYSKVPRKSQLEEAVEILKIHSDAQEPVEIHIRFAFFEHKIYVDLGSVTGQAIEIDSTGWRVVDVPPVYFRRTRLTSALPIPETGGNINTLFEIINVPANLQDLLVGWLVTCCFEKIPKPILALDGEQGSGKSNTTTAINRLLDPSIAILKGAPESTSDWLMIAQAAYVVSLDNISRLTPQFSDALCRACTGESKVGRELYTNEDVLVHSFRRVVILNGINLSDTRDDLSDRLLPIPLPVIEGRKKRYEADLENLWLLEYSKLSGALYDLCSVVLREMENTQVEELPRMADFARILATLDRELGTTSLNDYMDMIQNAAATIIDNDPFLKSLEESIHVTWKGSANELKDHLSRVSVRIYDRGYPQTAKAFTDKLKRSAPTLRKRGWIVEKIDANNHRNVVIWDITPPASIASMNSKNNINSYEEESKANPDNPSSPSSQGQIDWSKF